MTDDLPAPEMPTEVARRVGYLLSRLGNSARETFAKELAPFGVRPNQYGALVLLKKHEPTSQQTLAAALGVDRSMIVGIIDHLQALGAVERRSDPTDRRRHALRLTAAGHELIEQCDIVAERVQERRLAALSPQQRESLLSLLSILAANDPRLSARKPSVGLEPTTPSLPWKCSTS
jgi:DNA-binding MarR family transcriptional regulator